MSIRETTYVVEVLKSGQPRPYADTVREYLITIKSTQYGRIGLYPWVPHGDIEKRIKREEEMRAQGKMFGGDTPAQIRASQRAQVKLLIQALCQHSFREKDDDDGRTGMDAHFYPTLKSLKIDPEAGTIHVLIIEPFTD